ncbi:MAG: cytochrome c3 family protein [Gammaproteobacteria bacterium]|nr:cytochrome c3 family protein [Gammaproteobacteria bacterium]
MPERTIQVVWLFALLLVLPQLTSAQQQDRDRYRVRTATSGTDEAEAAVRRYRDQLLSSGRYEIDDAAGTLPYGPTKGDAIRSVPRADAHAGLKDYPYRKCVACHEQAPANIHTIRANNTCRQCHGGDPIASVEHYYSPLNPIRRHAYACAKCHEGANASFATYVVHEPMPSAADTRNTFPALFYSDRLMFWLIVGVFLLFIPHSVGWWIREWFTKKKPEA